MSVAPIDEYRPEPDWFQGPIVRRVMERTGADARAILCELHTVLDDLEDRFGGLGLADVVAAQESVGELSGAEVRRKLREIGVPRATCDIVAPRTTPMARFKGYERVVALAESGKPATQLRAEGIHKKLAFHAQRLRRPTTDEEQAIGTFILENPGVTIQAVAERFGVQKETASEFAQHVMYRRSLGEVA